MTIFLYELFHNTTDSFLEGYRKVNWSISVRQWSYQMTFRLLTEVDQLLTYRYPSRKAAVYKLFFSRVLWNILYQIIFAALKRQNVCIELKAKTLWSINQLRPQNKNLSIPDIHNCNNTTENIFVSLPVQIPISMDWEFSKDIIWVIISKNTFFFQRLNREAAKKKSTNPLIARTAIETIFFVVLK